MSSNSRIEEEIGTIDEIDAVSKKLAQKVEALDAELQQIGCIVRRGAEYSAPRNCWSVWFEISAGNENAPLTPDDFWLEITRMLKGHL